ncbi:MAG: YebC/PmpR family DNA-binding transcriptional regulator, partial [Syntrophomonadaceae bacterium]|nr:YebC/PmpR family DNA-binding transcriptional regulator [Syntrophomonadaceae bacterium]
AWMFNRVGLITVNKEGLNCDEDEFLYQVLEYGADDVRDDGEQFEIMSSPELLIEIKDALETGGYKVEEADIVMLPENSVEINDIDTASKIIKLIELLEDHDDVQNVYSNMSIPDELINQLS